MACDGFRLKTKLTLGLQNKVIALTDGVQIPLRRTIKEELKEDL
jgi:hypothetical protein